MENKMKYGIEKWRVEDCLKDGDSRRMELMTIVIED